MGDVLNRGTKDRSRWYCRFVDIDGKRKQKATHQPNKALPLRFLAEVEARVANGAIGVPDTTDLERRRATIAIRELSEQFLEEYTTPKIKDIKTYRAQARSTFKVRIWPTLGDLPAHSIRVGDVERLRDAQLAAGLKPGSVAQTLAVLSKLYSWAKKAELIACANPVAGCERTRAAQVIDFLSREEVSSLLGHLGRDVPDLLPIVRTAIYTGLRKGELFGLRWIDLHLDSARLDVNRSYRLAPKSGKSRYLPLHATLVPVLRRWRERCPATDEGLVFPVRDRSGAFRMGTKEDLLGLPKLLKTAGCHVPAKPWHGLRHTFASHFMMSGGNILTLQKLLGHADLKMTLVYAHLAPDFMANEVARLSFPDSTAGVTPLLQAGQSVATV